MPNWCSNSIVINGTKEEINALENLLASGKGDFDFNLFLPYPQEFKVLDDAYAAAKAADVPWNKLPKDGYNQGGYEWCIYNWGTKWNAVSPSSKRVDEENLSAWFDSAWSPPLGVIQAMSAMFPNLTITINYREEGMDFEGFATHLKGDVIESGEHEIEYDEDEDEDEDE